VLLWRQSAEFGILMLPTILHELLIAATFIIRPRARGTLPGWRPRLVGYVNSFLILAFLQVASRWFPHWLAPTDSELLRSTGFYLWLVGSVLGLWPLWYLRTSFSLEPEARTLVMRGPYRLARHPIYTIYILSFTGIWLRSPTLPFTLALASWFALLLVRIGYEERVLTAAFPEYEEYRARVAAFGPRLWPAAPRRERVSD